MSSYPNLDQIDHIDVSNLEINFMVLHSVVESLSSSSSTHENTQPEPPNSSSSDTDNNDDTSSAPPPPLPNGASLFNAAIWTTPRILTGPAKIIPESLYAALLTENGNSVNDPASTLGKIFGHVGSNSSANIISNYNNHQLGSQAASALANSFGLANTAYATNSDPTTILKTASSAVNVVAEFVHLANVYTAYQASGGAKLSLNQPLLGSSSAAWAVANALGLVSSALALKDTTGPAHAAAITSIVATSSSTLRTVADTVSALAKASAYADAATVAGKFSGVFGVIGSLASITASIITAASQDEKELKAAAGVQVALQAATAALSVAVMVGAVAGPVGLGAALVLSTFSPFSAAVAKKFGDLADEAWDRFETSGWEGDAVMGHYFAQLRDNAIAGAIPIASLLSGIVGDVMLKKVSEEQYKHVLNKYKEKVDGQDTDAAVAQFWADGFDTYERESRQDRLAKLKELSENTDADRIISLATQQVEGTMATVAGFLGHEFGANFVSGQNYVYTNGNSEPTTLTAGDTINLSKEGDNEETSQYVVFLSNFMSLSNESRETVKKGKSSAFPIKNGGVHKLIIQDGPASTTLDISGIAFPESIETSTPGGNFLSIDMGPGDDIVIVGPSAATISGGPGKDIIDYRAALTGPSAVFDAALFIESLGIPGSYIARKSGEGTFHVEKTVSQDVKVGKNRKNTVYYNTATSEEHAFQNQSDVVHGVEWIYGTQFGDHFTGYGGTDNFFGYHGDDYFEGRDGDDILIGGVGNDDIHGGNGDDILIGGSQTSDVESRPGERRWEDWIWGDDGNDQIWGDDGDGEDGGNDYLLGGAGNDQIGGEAGDDYVNGEDGDDILWGGSGSDILYGGVGNDTIIGDDGDDVLYGESGNNILFGSSGNDQLFGGGAADILIGGEGDDFLTGAGGDDILFADSGKDLLYGEFGNDLFALTKRSISAGSRLDGGDGTDLASMRLVSEAVSISLYAERVSLSGSPESFASITNIENIEGSSYGDDIGGNDMDNAIIGSGGNDTVFGGRGDDLLFGDEGDDQLFGEAGDDILDGGSGDDTLNGGDGADTYIFADVFGNDLIENDNPGSDLRNDVIYFKNLDYKQIFFVSDGQDLLIWTLPSAEDAAADRAPSSWGTIRVAKFYGSTAHSETVIVDQNQNVLLGSQIALLATSMAESTDIGLLQNAGVLNPNYYASMSETFAAAWTMAA